MLFIGRGFHNYTAVFVVFVVKIAFKIYFVNITGNWQIWKIQDIIYYMVIIERYNHKTCA